MDDTQDYPKLTLYEGFGERDTFEMSQKGCFDAVVETKDGNRYTIAFYTPVRLQQTLEIVVRDGDPCLAEPNLILVPEVTIDAIQNSIRYLWRERLFDHMCPDQGSEDSA